MSATGTRPEHVVSRRVAADLTDGPEQNSAVSWAAIFAGAVGAAALSLLLLILGTGLGFSAISPWTTEGISATTLGFSAIAWLSFTQIAASGMGGYLAGRLRTRWLGAHNDEVFFRDTAHGFLTWAVSSLLVLMLATSAMSSIIGGGMRAGAAVAGGAASAVGTVAETAAGAVDIQIGDGRGDAGDTLEYYANSLFRSNRSGTTGASRTQDTESAAREVSRIFAQALRTGSLAQEDQRYIAQLIAQRTDLSQQEAEQRVSEGFERVQTTLAEAETRTREIADEAREASAYAALWMTVALLLGAFAASLMAVFGGRQRDS